MQAIVTTFLNKLGYSAPSKAYTIIDECDDWYANRCIASFHERKTVQGEKYELRRLDFAKRLCQDDANLCEIVEINAGESNTFVNEILSENNFDTQFRKQLEKLAASGTAAAYIRVEDAVIMSDGTIKSGKVKINYVDADGFVPLTVVNDEVIEAAMSGADIVGGKTVYTVVTFTLGKEKLGQKKGVYYASTYKLDHVGKVIDAQTDIELGEVKPFAVLRTAEVNSFDNMEGFGRPKLYSAIPCLEGLDLAFNLFRSDLDKGEKLLLVNELMCKFDASGKAITPNEQAKKTFVMLGEKMPTQDSLIHEYNPSIRTDETQKAIELCLSLLSLMFGYGTKKYTFESGKITTATQYIGERQDAMQDLNKERYQVREYIEDIIAATVWFAEKYDGQSYTPNEDGILIDFDDSYIQDRASELDSMRLDAQQFGLPKLVKNYLMEKYNLTEEEAQAWYEDTDTDDEDVEV